jgi:hypothetical protein
MTQLQIRKAGRAGAHHLTRFCRGAACGRWPPQAVKSVSMKGGGRSFAALTVGSRGVGKRKTLAETGLRNG